MNDPIRVLLADDDRQTAWLRSGGSAGSRPMTFIVDLSEDDTGSC